MQVQTLNLYDVECPTPASSHHLVESLCSMPNLTNLTLVRKINDELCSALKAKASSIKVQTLKLDYVECPTQASSQHLVEALCSLPNLTNLTLKWKINDELCFALKAKASSIQVQTLKLDYVKCPTQASSQHLVEALCSLPNLTNLTLKWKINDELCFALKAKASSIQDCFPQIRKGNFRFNGVAQDDLNSFLHTLPYLEWFNDVNCSSDSANLGNSNGSDN
ncbi:uncharacterized protein LOC115921397 [Strongylocentrotus purpuratus]|uniref:Uncharacterized protein n=1 Tax=Strongylocentrotus purpuratus TaxID=7668 RepID=A0A7M7NFA4_STRPU|nr:uncharacterized protein LOC115921397 [Strongylocentrotus purpuratus]